VCRAPVREIRTLTGWFMLAEVHDQASGQMGESTPRSDAGTPMGDADAPGGVLDHGQNIGWVRQAGPARKDVAARIRLGLGAQKRTAGRSRAGRSRIFLRSPQTVDRGDSYSQRPFPWIRR